MRPLIDRTRLEDFLSALGRQADAPTRLFLVGGSTALLHSWRATTVDIDVRIEPDSGAVARAIPELKNRLGVNVELVSPLDFLPPLPQWRERSRFLLQEGMLAIFEFDLYSQALAKIERGFETDLADVRSMLAEGLEPAQLRHLFSAIVGGLYRFPAVDAGALAEDLERALAPERGLEP